MADDEDAIVLVENGGEPSRSRLARCGSGLYEQLFRFLSTTACLPNGPLGVDDFVSFGRVNKDLLGAARGSSGAALFVAELVRVSGHDTSCGLTPRPLKDMPAISEHLLLDSRFYENPVPGTTLSRLVEAGFCLPTLQTTVSTFLDFLR